MGVLFFLQIVGAVALAYLPFAGGMSVPWTGDQKVYLSTAIEMHQQESLLIPYLFGEPSYYKPPLQYWATLAGWKFLGFNLWGAFVPSVIATFVAALALWAVARRILPSEPKGSSAARAALWFVASLGTATFGMSAQMEIYLIAVGFLAWALALAHLDRDPLDRLRRPGLLYAAFAMAGVLAWVKSPLYSVLWVLGYLILLALRGEWRELRRLHTLGAWMLGSMVGASWFLIVLGMDYDRFVSDYILRETLGKGPNGGSAGELWLALAGFCVPFTLLALGALGSIWRASDRRVLSFVIAAGLPSAIFFSLHPYRVSTYLYVLVPLMAMLAAFVEWSQPRLAAALARASGVVLALGSGYLVWLSLRISLASGWTLAVIVTLGAVVCASFLKVLWKPRYLVAASLLMVAWIHALGVTLGERDLAGLRQFVSENHHRQLAMVDADRNIWHEVGLVSFALGRNMDRLYTPEEVLDALDSGHAVIVSEEQAKTVIPAVHELLEEEEDGRQVVLTPWMRLPVRRGLPVGELLRARMKLEMNRTYQILTLPPPGDWILPEGGV